MKKIFSIKIVYLFYFYQSKKYGDGGVNGDGGVMVSSLEVGAEGTGFESYY